MNRWAIDIDRDDIAQAAIVAEPEAPLPEGGSRWRSTCSR